MWTFSLRLGQAELLTLASLPVVAVLLIPAFAVDWSLALVPAVGYVVALGASYGLYRRYASERVQAAEPVAAAVAFRVVDVRGSCPLGRGTGDVVAVDAAGTVVPELCAPAEAALRLAAASENGVKEWCCPIVDHQLVFQRELKAAA